MVHPGTLLGQETGVLLVGLPVLQVDRLVSDVPVAREDVLPLAPAQPRQMQGEGIEEAELRGLPLRSGGAGRQIQRNDRQGSHLRLEVASFVVEFRHTEAAHHSVRLVARVERNPRVAFALRVMEVAVVAG